MEIGNTEERRRQFQRLLLRLAKNQSLLDSSEEKRKIYLELEEIYQKESTKDIKRAEGFRHFYSDIFAVLSQIDNDVSHGNLEILTQNIDMLRREYKAKNRDTNGRVININRQINKLYDHVNLEVARISYLKKTEMRSQDKLQKVTDTLAEVQDKIADMNNVVERADEMQKQYITILGIFAAIVLAFTAGIAFSTSVLENIANASIYRIMLVVNAIVFVLINVIYILTRFVLEIAKKGSDVVRYPLYMIVLNVFCIVASLTDDNAV